jgi:hypothetical protein
MASFLGFLLARTAIAFARYSKVERETGAVQAGMSRGEVVGKIGVPNYHAGKCGVIHNSDKNCALEFVYSHPFAPLVPKYFIVEFSTDDRVIKAEEWDSP